MINLGKVADTPPVSRPRHLRTGRWVHRRSAGIASAAAAVTRPKTPLELQEAQSLQRVASLAASIMVSSRKQGRGVWESERELRGWLSADGVEFSNNDVAAALALLEATKRIGRTPAKANAPRCGWLVTHAPGPSETVREDV